MLLEVFMGLMEAGIVELRNLVSIFALPIGRNTKE